MPDVWYTVTEVFVNNQRISYPATSIVVDKEVVEYVSKLFLDEFYQELELEREYPHFSILPLTPNGEEYREYLLYQENCYPYNLYEQVVAFNDQLYLVMVGWGD